MERQPEGKKRPQDDWRHGSHSVTTTKARNGNNKTFHICARDKVPEGVVSVDCEHTVGLSDDLLPPTTAEGWTDIIRDVDLISTQQNEITLNCHRGNMRSPTMAGLYMIRVLGMSVLEAMEAITSAYERGWHENFEQKVRAYLTQYAKLFAQERLPPLTTEAPQQPGGRKSQRLSGSHLRKGQ